MNVCNNCGSDKEDDKYAACAPCREASRYAKNPPAPTSTLRLILKENEAVEITGPITIIANRKADLVFKGTGKIGRRYTEDK